jgi:hypothetical protein
MNNAQIDQMTDRIREIRDQIASLPAMLVGSLLAKHNRVEREDGTVHVSGPYYTFQYRRADGTRAWKRIPKGAHKTVRKLVSAGDLYQKLEKEYAALATELSLGSEGKKK